MRYLLFLFCCCLSVGSFSQTVYLVDTAFTTDVGWGGAPASCKTNGMTYNAVNMDTDEGYKVADAFTVPPGTTWVFDTVIVYGYQYGSSIASPFQSCSLQIYAGTPGTGAPIIWGDPTANVLKSVEFTGIYKVDTFSSDDALLSTKRPIMAMKLYLSPAPHLNSGTYWLAWSATVYPSSNPNPAVTPYKVLPGRINPPGQKARRSYHGTWSSVTDNGLNVGLCKIIKASATAAVEDLNSKSTFASLCSPNPFNGIADISYNLPTADHVDLSVYNTLGQLVTTLVNKDMPAGEHHITFNAAELPAGIYYYKLSTASGTESRQIVLVK